MNKKLYSTIGLFLGLMVALTAQEMNIKSDALFGSMRARHLGPALMSGRVIDLEVHPENGSIFYVGSAGGGVWKTIDGGITFTSIFDDHIQSIGQVQLDPQDPDNNIWVGTGEIWTRNSVSVGDGLYHSTDGGQSWKKKGFENSERISAIEIHPENSDVMYVGVLGNLWGDSDDRGVYKSTDGGETWDQIKHIDATTGCSDLVMDPSNPDILYASFWEFRRTGYSFSSGGASSALYKSTDGGASWNKIHNGFPAGKLGRIAVAVAPSNSDILYSVLETEENEDKGLYRSDDGGQNWTHLNSNFELTVRPFYFSRIVVDPKNPDIVLKAGLYGSISNDGGNTFRPLTSGNVHADIHDFVFDPDDSDVIYLACDGGVYRSYNGGDGWVFSADLPLSQYYHVTVDDSEPYKVFGGLQDNGSWVGVSESPGGINASDWISVGAGDGFRVYPHPGNSDVVYSEMQGAEGIWRVDIANQQDKTVKPYREPGDPKLRFNWNAPITTSVHDDEVLMVGSQFVHLSEDSGETWRKISPDLTTNDPAKLNQAESGGLSVDNSGAENHCTVFTIGESPLDKNMIWVGTDDGNVQVTMDRGENWKNVTGNLTGLPSNTWVYHIEPSAHDKMTAYAVFDGHTQNDMKPYVYKTTDAGQTWTSIVTNEIEMFARSIQEDPVNPDLLYLGTETGLYVTVNGGINWSLFDNNMPRVAVHHVTIQPRDNALVLGTHGRGIIVIDDISALREVTPEVIEKDVHFFNHGPQVISDGGTFGNSFLSGEFVGANPSAQAKITYYLKKRHTFGKMRLEVLNDKDEVIADLSPGKRKGINTVYWNYRYQLPKMAKAKTLAFGGLTAPEYEPGTYKVKLTKGKKEYTSTVTLKYNDKSVFTSVERKQRFDVAMEMYNMNEDLAYMVDKMDMVYDQSMKIQSENPDAKAVKDIRSLASDIQALKETLVVTTGDNYVGAAEPRLREKLASLYSEITGYRGKPSGAQLKKMADFKAQMLKANGQLEKLMSKVSAINAMLKSSNIAPLEFRDKETFLNAD